MFKNKLQFLNKNHFIILYYFSFQDMEFHNGYILSSSGCKEVCVNGKIIEINPLSQECRGMKRKRDAHKDEQSKKYKF